MKSFKEILRLTPTQKSEVERYLGCIGVLNEYAILKLVRRMKQMEQKLEVRKYE